MCEIQNVADKIIGLMNEQHNAVHEYNEMNINPIDFLNKICKIKHDFDKNVAELDTLIYIRVGNPLNSEDNESEFRKRREQWLCAHKY